MKRNTRNFNFEQNETLILQDIKFSTWWNEIHSKVNKKIKTKSVLVDS